MVLQDNRSPMQGVALHIPRLDLDPSRIAATSGALLLNLAVLALLLIPATIPPTSGDFRPVTTIIELIDPPKPVPLPPDPEPVPVVPQQTRDITPSTPALPTVPTTQPIAVDPVIVDPGTLPTAATGDALAQPGSAEIAAPPGPVTGMALRYLRADPPPYPIDALRAGSQGTVMLRVLVDVDGTPLQVDIQRSSGNRKLDDAARRHVLARWRFEPAMRDGVAVQAIGIVPIAFNLGR